MSAAWYLLNYIAPAMRRKEMLEARVRAYNSQNNTDLTIFAPEIVEATPKPDGGIRITNRAILYHYIFIQGELQDIKRLCSSGGGLSFVLKKTDFAESASSHASATAQSASRYVTLSDSEIRAFRIIAYAYSNHLPYYSPRDIQLLHGDEVEVVSGPFAGLRGTFIARRGSSNGSIVVQASGQIGSIAYDIKADTIRILRFSKDSRRAYDQIDAFIPKLQEALSIWKIGQPLTPAQAAPLHVFTRRFSATEIPGAKLDAKLQALLSTAHRILGNEPEARVARARYEKRLPQVTNPRTLDLIHRLMDK